MKQSFLFLFVIVAFCNFAKAQSGWSTTEFGADELKGQAAYTAQFYIDNNGNRFTMWSNEVDYFRITSASHIFNYRVSGSLKEVDVTVGFYDVNDHLIEKVQMTFWPNDDNPRIAHNSVFLSKNKKKGMKVIQYLQNEKGYIRIIAPLYHSISGFDLKVPCLKSEPQKKEKDVEDMSALFGKGLDALRQLKIIGVRDTSSMMSYLAYIKQWGKYNSYKYGITVDDTVSSDTVVLMHVETRIYPNLVSSKTLNIPIYLLYDIAVAIDTIPFEGYIHLNDIRIRWEYEPDYAQTHTEQLLNLPSQQIKELLEETRALANSLSASGIGAKEHNTFLLNDAWLRTVQDAENNQQPQAKIYLELQLAVILSTSWLITAFPLLAK